MLEAGCGIGAQTLTLARQSPQARFTSIDISAASPAQAQQQARAAAGLTGAERFDEAIRDLLRTSAPDGVFCYTFFKGVGVNRGAA